ncbi:type II secretion system protein GspL [Pseudomonas sp. dw_358]|uniref:type II secretion system protein GspL n=1 Tax=Pseudomonas sp. dw_358 TaxID=2720083 RepID=UPI001BD4B573|nr:type II secretion system protein GspL [Pseudomonas sp. dw_358]
MALFSSALRHLQQLATEWNNRWWASLARRGLQAWLLELHGLLPVRLRDQVTLGPKMQRLAWPLTAAADPTRPAVLLLAPHEVLVQHIALPTTATRDLLRVLAFEIDKYTPFAPEQVHFTATVVGQAAGRASVLLLAIAQERLAAILQQSAVAGLSVIGLRVQAPPGPILPGDLLPAALRPKVAVAARRNRMLAGIALVLLVALMVTTLNQRQGQVERLREAVMSQRAEVAELETSRRELQVTRDAASYLSRLKSQRPTVSLMLADLSACLGDDTWLEQLQVQDGTDLSLTGQSKHASALIGRVSACFSVQGPQFQGVIQPDPQSGNDRFSLVAHLTQESPDAPRPDRQ